MFNEAGIEVTRHNKKDIDRAFHDITGIEYKDCSATWKQLKQELAGDGQKRREIIQRLKGLSV